METFRSKYLPIIMALQKDPLASIKDIAQDIDISWPTAKKWYEEAIENKIITRVVASIDMTKLGFRRHFVLANVNDYRSLRILEEICDLHPYTSYRSRIIGGSGISLFMIFEIPDTNTADNNIKDFFLILYRESIIGNYSFLTSTGQRISTKSNLNEFNMEKEKWDFEPDVWLSRLNTATSQDMRHDTKSVDLDQFDKKQFYILRLMTDNLLPTQKEIKAKYEESYNSISRSEFHRQFNYLKNEFVHDTVLIYDHGQFGVSEYFLYILPDLTQNEIGKFFSLMKNNPPPFNFTLEAVGMNNIIMWGNMPADLARQLSYQLWKKFSQTKSYRFAIEEGWAARYLFYHENFDTERKKWKDNYNYMVDNPMKYYRQINEK